MTLEVIFREVNCGTCGVVVRNTSEVGQIYKCLLCDREFCFKCVTVITCSATGLELLLDETCLRIIKAQNEILRCNER